MTPQRLDLTMLKAAFKQLSGKKRNPRFLNTASISRCNKEKQYKPPQKRLKTFSRLFECLSIPRFEDMQWALND